VPSKRLNEQYRRNRERFPEDFAFQLTAEEADSLRSQIATSSSHGGRRYRPPVFTEYGALMAANILNSARAVQMNTTCGDAVGWTALSVWETGERSGERESTFLWFAPLRKCARRCEARPRSHGNSLILRKG